MTDQTPAGAIRTTDPDSDPAVDPNPRSARVGQRDRIVGLDLARFVAIAGMMATHVWLYADLSTRETIWGSELFEGRASALFAVLAGVGAVLSTRTPLRQNRRAAARLTLLGRGVALVVIGLTLTLLTNPILVILVYYGVLFWVLALVITWKRWVLIALAAVLAVAAPIAAYLIGLATGVITDSEASNPNWLSLGDPVSLVRGLFVTGTYPVLIWLAYGIVGVVVGRSLLAARTVETLRALCVRLVAIGVAIWLVGIALAAVAQHVLGGVHGMAVDLGITDAEAQAALDAGGRGRPLATTPFSLISAAAHHGTTFDLMVTIGFALTAIGLLVLLGTVLGPLARRILTPVIGAGSAPLTVYSAHVLLVGAVTLSMLGKPYNQLTYTEYVALDTPWYLSSLAFYLMNLVLALSIGTMLVLLGKRGPLETFVTWVGRLFARIAGTAKAQDARNTPGTTVVD